MSNVNITYQQRADWLNIPLSTYMAMTPHQRLGAEARVQRLMNPSGNYPRYNAPEPPEYQMTVDPAYPEPTDYSEEGLIAIEATNPLTDHDQHGKRDVSGHLTK